MKIILSLSLLLMLSVSSAETVFVSNEKDNSISIIMQTTFDIKKAFLNIIVKLTLI